ncbi:MAG: TonB-dependent receptor [Alistipes sp.]
MKGRMFLLVSMLCAVTAVMAATPAPQNDSIARTLAIEQVDIAARRPLSRIGVQRTVLDTIALRENITSSLADVLSANSTVFIKSYGRATLATASFRGTSPSHTQVTWNGMKVNSPMLGQVDFSLIPSYFIDDANLYYGAGSVSIAGGGLGGAVTLGTEQVKEPGFNLRYIQGIGSFSTFDEFLHLTYKGKHWSSSTRALCSTSKNDFLYTNYRKKEFTMEDGVIVDSYYPKERNKNGDFRDVHLLQEFFYQTDKGHRFSLSAWYMNSHRGLPLLTTDRNEAKQERNTQDEQTVRAVVGWDRIYGAWKVAAKAGYTYTDLLYLYRKDPEGQGTFIDAIRSVNKTHTAMGTGSVEYCPSEKWMFSADLSLYQHYVRSADTASVNNASTERPDTLRGYREARFELSGFVSAKWRPIPRLGLAVSLREELSGNRTAFIPAGFIDYLASKKGNIVLKASIARNYRFPTLNDLYFRPGGNRNLKPERGYTYDGGVEFAARHGRYAFSGSVTAFSSRIEDWILWIGTAKYGVWTPINIKEVHSYGVEVKFKTDASLGGAWRLMIDGNFAWTRSINQGEPFSPADRSVGKQLPYIPKYSSAVTAKLLWRTWTMTYKWCWYSERYTMSSNDLSRIGRVKPYFMNDLALEKTFSLKWANLSVKGSVNNLFNESYESVLARPMAGINYAIFIGITPKF